MKNTISHLTIAVRLLTTALFALAIAGCSTTRLDSQWSNPEFAGKKISGKVMVVGVSRDDTLRRLYEDDLATHLASLGVNTVRSYELVPGPIVMDGAAPLLKAAREANANMILSSAVIAREHVERIITEPMPTYGNRFYGWYAYYWPYAYTRTEVRSFDRYTVGTSLTDVISEKIIWSARTQTENIDRADREIRAFVHVIVDALKKGAML